MCQARMALQHVVTLVVLVFWYLQRHEPSRVSTAAHRGSAYGRPVLQNR